jgi:hypothetical protein
MTALQQVTREEQAPASSGADLGDRIEAALRRFIYHPSPHAYTVATLWPMHTHLTPFVGTWTPYLLITSPRWDCGKSQLLDVMGLLSLNPQRVGRTSEATGMRLPKEHHNRLTLLPDEADSYIGSDGWRGLLNDGAKRGGQAALQVKDEKEDTGYRTVLLPAFCPKAIALLEGTNLQALHGSSASRCITLRMEPAPRGAIAPFELWDGESSPTADAETVRTLGREVAAWAAANVTRARAVRQRVALDAANRLRDTGTPIMLVAELLGGAWPEKVRAALAWARGEALDAEKGHTPALRILESWRTLYAERPDADFVSNAELLEVLNDPAHDFEWPGWNHGTGLRVDQVKAYLRALKGPPPTKQCGERGRTVGAKRLLWEKWLT